MDDDRLPKGWKTTTIESIFNLISPEDQKRFVDAVTAKKDIDRNIAVFREIFIRNRASLELNNLDAEFCAYAVAYSLEELRKGTRR